MHIHTYIHMSWRAPPCGSRCAPTFRGLAGRLVAGSPHTSTLVHALTHPISLTKEGLGGRGSPSAPPSEGVGKASVGLVGAASVGLVGAASLELVSTASMGPLGLVVASSVGLVAAGSVAPIGVTSVGLGRNAPAHVRHA